MKYLSHHKLLAVHCALEVLDALGVKAVVEFDALSEELSVVECSMKILARIVSVSRSKHQHVAECHCREVVEDRNVIFC